MSPAHAYLAPIVHKERNKNRIVALLTLALAVGSAIWGFSLDDTASETARMASLGVVLFPVVPIVLFLNHKLKQGLALLAEPDRIVWFYGLMKAGKVHRAMVGSEDGKLFRFDLPLISMKEGFSQEAFEHLRASAPQATQGFSEAHRLAFRANPAQLKS